MRLGFISTPASRGLLYQAWMVDKYGTFSGMRNGKENRSTQWYPATVSLCLPEIPLDMNWNRNQAAAREVAIDHLSSAYESPQLRQSISGRDSNLWPPEIETGVLNHSITSLDYILWLQRQLYRCQFTTDKDGWGGNASVIFYLNLNIQLKHVFWGYAGAYTAVNAEPEFRAEFIRA
jgi:hypothetical protein